MKQSSLIIVFVLAGILVLSLFLIPSKTPPQISIAPGENVHMENGTQVIEIKAGGGYTPAQSVAKAGIPTVIRFSTNGAFDCSSSIRIPSLNLSKILPQNGTQDIDIGTPESGPLQGMCGMGMFPFSVTFQ